MPETIWVNLRLFCIMSTKSKYTVNGMTCDGCASTVTKLLSRVQGVQETKVSLNEKTAEVTHENVPLSALKIALRGFPYEIVERI